MSETTFKLSNQEQAKFISYGATFAESELTADECIDSFAKAVGVKPAYELFVAGSDAWKEGYAKTKNIPFDSEAVRKAWSRFFGRVSEKFGITKPQKPTESAQKKSEQRKKAEEKLNALKARPDEELLAEVAMLTANPTSENLSKAKVLSKAVESKRKEALKDRMDNIKELQKKAKELIGKCLDESILEEVINQLN
jgi:hypothetical protein